MVAISRRRCDGLMAAGSSSMSVIAGSLRKRPQRPSLGDRLAVWQGYDARLLINYPAQVRNDEKGPKATRPDERMLERPWQTQLESGEYASLEDLAKDVGCDRTYVGRMLRLTSLAPDIIEAILRGDEPDGLSLEKLRKNLPVRWEEQRKTWR